MNTLLTDNELEQVQHHHTLQKDYFYVPVFSYGSKPNRSILVYQDDAGKIEEYSYASKVVAGKTLHEAIRHDLTADFAYRGEYTITSVQTLDSARNKRGQQLTRLLVLVTVAAKFEVANIQPAGLTPLWYNEATKDFTAHYADDVYPTVDPTQFLTDLCDAIMKERERQGIAPNQYTSLAVMVDNRYAYDLFSNEDVDGEPVANRISGKTMSPNFVHGLMKPIGTDISQGTLTDFDKPRFDLSKPATIVQIGNVQIAFTLSPIDHKTGHVL